MTKDDRTRRRDEEILRYRGQRLTPQRRLVLEIIRDSRGHMTVEEVADEVVKRSGVVSLAAIYRILTWLTDQELVCVTDIGTHELVYEYLDAHRHHHLVCQQCGSQVEVPFDLMSPVIAEIRRRYGFEPRIDHQAIFGVCRDCQTASSDKD